MFQYEEEKFLRAKGATSVENLSLRMLMMSL